MKLLADVIDLLADENGSLNAALLKTKVLLHRIGHAELAEWVNNELNGYAEGLQLPDYRVVDGRVTGIVQNSAMVYNDMDLPTYHLDAKLREHLERHELRQSMAVLQEMAGGGTLRGPLEPRITAKIGETLSDGYWVQRGWVEITQAQVKNGLAQVRARLLDFMLKLQDQLGEAKEEDVKDAASKTDVTAMFQGAVFGSNNTFVIGSQNVAHVKITVKKGDFDSLAKQLRESGVSEPDISELHTAVKADGELVDPKAGFGQGVRAWIGRMMGKVADASWQIELGVAGNLLTDALKAYYF